MLVRLVPIRAGKPNRFAFTNMWLDSRTPGKIKLGGIFAASEARLEATEDHVTLRPMKGEVAVNGEPVRGPRPLAHGDLVALKDKDKEAAYEFEEDLRLAKQTRRQKEAARGIHRRPPPEILRCGHGKVRFSVAVDETGITASITEADLAALMEGIGQAGGKPPSFLKPQTYMALRWEELDTVEFSPLTHTAKTGDVLEAMLSGAGEGWKAASAIAADAAESDAEATFHAPAYSITFLWHGKVMHGFGRIDGASCELLAQAIEYHAPIDLTRFGSARNA